MNKNDEKNGFPCWALLALYEKAGASLLYVNHFENFKLLKNWLSQEPQIIQNEKEIPALHSSYEMQQLAAILDTTPLTLNYNYQITLEKLKNGDGY